MRVALVTYGLHIGGMESFLLDLAEILRREGMVVVFVITDSAGAWHARPKSAGFELREAFPSPWHNRAWHAQHVAAALQDFDAILLNNSAAAQAALGRLPRSAKVISVLHNHQEEIYQTGLCGLANLDAVVCVGTRILNETRQRGATVDQAIHIPHGVDVPLTWKKERHRSRADPLRVIFVGRVEHGQKGVLHLPLIVAEAERLGAKLRLDVVGDGVHLDRLKSAFAAQSISSSVTFHGRLDHAKALELLDRSDVLLMPSRFEGFPVTLIEAMAHGVVPVASRLHGITDDAVTDGANGLLPAVDDITGFARALVTLQDVETRLRMSNAAWQVADEKFKMGIMGERYVSLLKSSTQRRSAEADDTDAIGPKLFGAAWRWPVSLVGFARALRRGRLGLVLKRKIGSRLSKAM